MTTGSRLADFLLREIEAGSFPGAQYVVAQGDRVIAEDAFGLAVVSPERIVTTKDTIYDLASLTKPLVTALLAVILADRKLIDLSAQVVRYLPEFETPHTNQISLTDLLVHRSGLPKWRPLYLEAASPSEVLDAIARSAEPPSGDQTRRTALYGDLNYILMGIVLERVTAESLDGLADQLIFKPLGLTRTMFNPPTKLKAEIAATEQGREYERRQAASDRAVAGHDAMIWGHVHDGNANFLKGVAGHAGLFSTACEVVRIAREFLPGGTLVRPGSLDLFTTDFTSPPESRSIGWLLASTVDCSAGPALPPNAFGHSGFTGTSVWVDPVRGWVSILLTNRVHPTVRNVDMKRIRCEFNRLAAETDD